MKKLFDGRRNIKKNKNCLGYQYLNFCFSLAKRCQRQKDVKEIFNLAKDNKIQICLTKEILDEFYQVLNYPKFFSRLKSINKTPKDIINEFLENVKFYPSKEFETIISKACPTDDKFLSCALSSEASFIISGDKHLLKIKEFKGIPILSPEEFLRKYFKNAKN